MIKLGNPTTWYNQSIFVNNNVSKYVALHTHIAKVQPVEYLRPLIHLHVYSKINPSKSVYLVGGMGPLSDSHFIYQLYKKIKNTSLYDIHLFSIPPPRSLLQIKKLYSYVSQLRLIKDCIQHVHKNQEVFLISNAAHTYRHILSSLFLPIFNMIPDIHHKLKEITFHSPKNTKFLILSTTQVSVHKMYSNMFPLEDIIELSSSQVIKIQFYIDQIKQNRYNYKINPIHTFIQSIVSTYRCYHIHAILACTELSIWYYNMRKKLSNTYMITDISCMMQEIILEHMHSTR